MPIGLLSRLTDRLRPPRPVILMYHRVARADHDPWSLCVRPERFADQLRWLGRTRRVLPMAEFARRHAAGTLPRDAVAITFDDGYADNLHAARPALAAAGMPATLFVVSGAIGSSDAFWWDELADLVLAGPEAACDLAVLGTTFTLRWDDRVADPTWRAEDAPPGAREAVFIALWRLLRGAGEAERRGAMAAIRALHPAYEPRLPRPMDLSELGALVADDAFSLGGHSISHPALTDLPDEEVRREMTESLAFCRAVSEADQVGFAYPYGQVDERVWRVAATTGVPWACATRRGAVAPGADGLTLPRLAVGDWSGDELGAHLRSL